MIALRDRASNAWRMMSSQDGRWAFVSSSLTASVALSVTVLAMSAAPVPVTASGGQKPETTILDFVSRAAGKSLGAKPYEQLGLIAPPAITEPVRRLIEMAAIAAAPKPSVEKRTLRVDEGETIMGMLADAGVSPKDAASVVAAIQPIYSPRAIRSGQTFEATFGTPEQAHSSKASPEANSDEGVAARTRRLLSLSFEPSIERQITVSLSALEEYSAQEIRKELEGRYQHAGGTIDSSLYLAAIDAGIPANVVVEMIRIFSYDVDFQRDVHPGDSFEVFYNHYFTQEGRPARPGDIVAASMTLSGRTHTLYRYEDGGETEYFDPTGRSSKSLLMKTPVDGARISSTFGQRSHPILGYTRMHKGIDFAVPKGTPVVAAGNGTVSFSGNAGGYGNLLVLTHSAGYSTAYGHLSRFAVHSGMRVRQGQVIAYSGMTGLATGPHLHYEVRIKNTQLNPASIKVASGRTLTGSALKKFVTERARVDALMASRPLQTKLALASDLRNTTE